MITNEPCMVSVVVFGIDVITSKSILLGIKKYFSVAQMYQCYLSTSTYRIITHRFSTGGGGFPPNVYCQLIL